MQLMETRVRLDNVYSYAVKAGRTKRPPTEPANYIHTYTSLKSQNIRTSKLPSSTHPPNKHPSTHHQKPLTNTNTKPHSPHPSSILSFISISIPSSKKNPCLNNSKRQKIISSVSISNRTEPGSISTCTHTRQRLEDRGT